MHLAPRMCNLNGRGWSSSDGARSRRTDIAGAEPVVGSRRLKVLAVRATDAGHAGAQVLIFLEQRDLRRTARKFS